MDTHTSRAAIRAIVFDFGGVLIDWDPRYLYRKYFANENAMEDFFEEIGFAEWNYEQDKGRAFADAIALHTQKFPHHAELMRAYPEHYIETIGGAITGTVDILHAVKRAGYPLFGLSNWSAETFPQVRAQYSFFDLFDVIVLSGEEKIAKPDPRIFQALLEKTGCRAAECLFIDDAEKNIVVARELNFQTIHFESPEQLARELEHYGLVVASSDNANLRDS